MLPEKDSVEITIRIADSYVPDDGVINSVLPDNNSDIEYEKENGIHLLRIKNVRLSSISSLTMDLLESIEISKKMWEEKL